MTTAITSAMIMPRCPPNSCPTNSRNSVIAVSSSAVLNVFPMGVADYVDVTGPKRVASKRNPEPGHLFPARSLSALFLGHHQFGAPVLGATLLGVIRGDRFVLAVAGGGNPIGVDTAVYQRVTHRIGAVLRQLHVRRWIAGVVGVSYQLHFGRRIRLEDHDQIIHGG